MTRPRKTVATVPAAKDDAGQSAGVVPEAGGEVANTEQAAVAEPLAAALPPADEPESASTEAPRLVVSITNRTLRNVSVGRVFMPAGQTVTATMPDEQRLLSFKKQFAGYVEVHRLQDILTMEQI